MTDLLSQLQSADKGGRSLDWKICHELNCCGDFSPATCPNLCLAYTTNLQDAVSLLTDGEEYEISTLYGIAHVMLPLNTNDPDGPYDVRREDGDVCLAFCECYIKAHQSKAEAA